MGDYCMQKILSLKKGKGFFRLNMVAVSLVTAPFSSLRR